MHRIWFAVVLGLIGTLAAAAEEPDWAALAAQDLQAMHDAIAADHPGPVLDPAFGDRLETGLAAGLAQAPRAETLSHYLYLLVEFANALPDRHLGVWGNRDHPQWADVRRDDTLFPGFVLSWRRGGIVVAAAFDADAPPAGARLVECDGLDALDLARRNALRFDGDAASQADLVRAVPAMTVDQGQLDFLRPAQCRFALDGAERTYALAWRPVRFRALQPALAAAAFGEAPAMGAQDLPGGVLWLSIPTLDPQGDDAAAFDAMRARLAAPQGLARIVFDLRGNGGGSSFLARGLAAALYGEAAVAWGERRLRTGEPDAIRASDKVRAHFQALRDAMGAFPSDQATASYLDAALAAIDAAMAAGEPLARLGRRGPPTDEPRPQAAFDGQVVVVVDGRAFSSALLFVDLLRAVDDVVVVGWPTRAHGLYGEVRDMPLPSGWASFAVSTKAFLGSAVARPTGLEPDILWDGEIADTAGLQAFEATLTPAGSMPAR